MNVEFSLSPIYITSLFAFYISPIPVKYQLVTLYFLFYLWLIKILFHLLRYRLINTYSLLKFISSKEKPSLKNINSLTERVSTSYLLTTRSISIRETLCLTLGTKVSDWNPSESILYKTMENLEIETGSD